MKKIIKLQWNNYKNSDSGKEAIASFDKLTDPNTTIEELYQLACKYDPQWFKNTDANEMKEDLRFLNFLDMEVRNIKEEVDKLHQKALTLILKRFRAFSSVIKKEWSLTTYRKPHLSRNWVQACSCL